MEQRPLRSFRRFGPVDAEVAQDVLVGEGHAKLLDPDRPVHGHDLAAVDADVGERWFPGHASSLSTLRGTAADAGIVTDDANRGVAIT